MLDIGARGKLGGKRDAIDAAWLLAGHQRCCTIGAVVCVDRFVVRGCILWSAGVSTLKTLTRLRRIQPDLELTPIC